MNDHTQHTSIEYNWINIPCLDSAGWCGVLAGLGRAIQGNTKRGTETGGVQHAWTVLSQSVCRNAFVDTLLKLQQPIANISTHFFVESRTCNRSDIQDRAVVSPRSGSSIASQLSKNSGGTRRGALFTFFWGDQGPQWLSTTIYIWVYWLSNISRLSLSLSIYLASYLSIYLAI